MRYQWLKDQFQFIRTDMQTYIFISNNGKIYFSEVTYYSYMRRPPIVILMSL